MEIIMLLILSLSGTLLPIFWHFPLVFVSGFKILQETHGTSIKRILMKIKPSSTMIKGEEPRGFLWGPGFIGYMHETTSEKGSHGTLYLLTSMGQITEMQQMLKENEKTIPVYEYEGNVFDHDYKRRILDVTGSARSRQQRILNQIKQKLVEKNSFSVFLSGESRSGKSMLGSYLARDLKGSLCKSFRPTEPGSFATLYTSVQPTQDSPLIVLIDEADEVIKQIFPIPAAKHKYTRTTIVDKSSWNGFFDDIDSGSFPHAIFLLTSNTPKKEIDQLDASLLGRGRMELCLELESDKGQFSF